MAIHSGGQTVFRFIHPEGIILGAGEEVDESAGGASGIGVDRIVEVCDRTSEGQAVEVYGADFIYVEQSIFADDVIEAGHEMRT